MLQVSIKLPLDQRQALVGIVENVLGRGSLLLVRWGDSLTRLMIFGRWGAGVFCRSIRREGAEAAKGIKACS